MSKSYKPQYKREFNLDYMRMCEIKRYVDILESAVMCSTTFTFTNEQDRIEYIQGILKGWDLSDTRLSHLMEKKFDD